MTADRTKLRGQTWWVVGISLALLSEIAVCLVLFVPQSRKMSRLSGEKRDMEATFNDVSKAAGAFTKVQQQIDQTRRMLAELKLQTDRPAQEAIMTSLRDAGRESGAEIMNLNWARPKRGVSSSDGGDAWALQCRGPLKSLVAFLRRIEADGLLLDAKGFRAMARPDGRVDLSVTIRAVPPKGGDGLAVRRAEHPVKGAK